MSDVIFLMGPTASGKTRLAELLCAELPCEVISVDSSAVYHGMDIGSAKPDAELLARMPHRLVDIRQPWETYSVADFLDDALTEVEEIQSRGKIPLLVGGTMLYFKAMRDGLAELPPADPLVRAEIEQLAELSGWSAVHEQLAAVDPQSAERIHPNDPQRLQRALEVYRLSGVTMTELHRRQDRPLRKLGVGAVQICVQPSSRELLHQRIEQRFDAMLADGLVDEVKQLLENNEGLEQLPAMRAVGYRQVIQFLNGELDSDAMRERGIIASRQLAKRQLTWLRGWPDLHTFHASEEDYKFGLTSSFEGQDRSILYKALKICRYLVNN